MDVRMQTLPLDRYDRSVKEEEAEVRSALRMSALCVGPFGCKSLDSMLTRLSSSCDFGM